MFFYPKRKLKAVCEECGSTPHAPRRRCPQCDQLVCVSKCWNKKVNYCKNCAAIFLPNTSGQVKQLTNSETPFYPVIHHVCLKCQKLFKLPRRPQSEIPKSQQNYCSDCHRSLYGW